MPSWGRYPMVVSDAMRMVPSSGSSSPASILSSVVLPAPFGPDSPMRSLFLTCHDTSSSRTRSPYRLVRPSTWIMGSGGADGSGGRQAQEVQAGPLQHRAVLGLHEVEPVLVDHLDLHALPLLPADGADGGQDLLLDGGGKGDASGRRGLVGAAAAGAGDRRNIFHQPLLIAAFAVRRLPARTAARE